MKIDKNRTARPLRLNDKVLNKTLGAVIARLSQDDVQAIVLRHAEVEVARKIRQRWSAQAKSVAESSAPNARWSKEIAASADWASVADEALAYIRADQDQLDKEELLARANIFLCDKVIAALVDASGGASPASAYGPDGSRGNSPLQYLSAAGVSRASRRVDRANDAWSSAMESFAADARSRNSFAGTSGSVKLSQIDSCSPDSFEEWTARLLERDGCKVLRRRGGPNDQGADVIAITPCGFRVVLQCKFSTKVKHTVDPRFSHELNGTARQEHGADIVGLVTNRTASLAAQDFAAKHRIHFINRSVLERWATYGISWLPSDDQAAVGG
ncbi:restriction endonuclease [Micromonospora sediminicola]|uniref:restriction endonuclease n=1 Tax=Micromonospora sediminicola TaxID=946078 RepID=UPI0037B737F6